MAEKLENRLTPKALEFFLQLIEENCATEKVTETSREIAEKMKKKFKVKIDESTIRWRLRQFLIKNPDKKPPPQFQAEPLPRKPQPPQAEPVALPRKPTLPVYSDAEQFMDIAIHHMNRVVLNEAALPALMRGRNHIDELIRGIGHVEKKS